jgi:hypothetical protein
MPHKQIITDISKYCTGNLSDHTGMHYSSDVSKTNISDLYNDTPKHGSGRVRSHGDETRSPCVIRCTDILSHIKTCPVCSKLYMPIPSQGSGKWTCEEGSCYKTLPGVSQKTVNIIIALLILFIIILVKVMMGQSKKD